MEKPAKGDGKDKAEGFNIGVIQDETTSAVGIDTSMGYVEE